jgi:ribosomal protein S14
MTQKLIAIAIAAAILGAAVTIMVRDYLHKLRCQRCARPYGIFTRNGMEVCRRCKTALDALAVARAAWFKARRLNA